MNLITLMWLKNINLALVNIVKTEYSLELRQNTQLTELVPRISVNIDSLLARYDQGPAVQNVEVRNLTDQPRVAKIQRKNPTQFRYKQKKVKSKFCRKGFYLGDKFGISIQIVTLRGTIQDPDLEFIPKGQDESNADQARFGRRF